MENFRAAMGMSTPMAWAVAIAELVASVALLAGPFTKDSVTLWAVESSSSSSIGANLMVPMLKNGLT